MGKNIYRIVCTGGPCAGKSTFISRANEIFNERGYKVLVIHETATELITGGITPMVDNVGMYGFQKYVIDMMITKEDLYVKAAEELKDEEIIILIDRGIHDNRGYVSESEWQQIISAFNLTDEEIDKRYDLVLHLTTAAKGEQEAYTLSNNAARYESIDEAIRVDDMILEGWSKHPNVVVIGNEIDFNVKIRRAIQAIFTYLGKEKPVERFEKYLVEVNDQLLEQLEKLKASRIYIVQNYLKAEEGKERRIRTREIDGQVTCYYSEVNILSASSRTKRDRIISNSEYVRYSLDIDPSLHPIVKTRYTFPYKGNYFRLDIFSFDQSKGLLSIQVADENAEVDCPDFIEIKKEVTDILEYKNLYLAKLQKFI